MESFEITDYDLENEFNIARPRRKLSKKQQMLGTLRTIVTSRSHYRIAKVASVPTSMIERFVYLFDFSFFLISGIWADDSDEDELSARPSFKTFNKGPKNYTAPVNFVAGGIQQAGKPKDKKEDNDEEDDEEETCESQTKYQNNSR